MEELRDYEKSVESATLQDLNFMRWNAFLEADSGTLEEVLREAKIRSQLPDADPRYLHLVEGCVEDLNRLDVGW